LYNVIVQGGAGIPKFYQLFEVMNKKIIIVGDFIETQKWDINELM